MTRGASSGQPGGGSEDPANGGGFVSFGPDDAGREAPLRAGISAEAVDGIVHSGVLSRLPRPLTDDETAVLWESVTPLLRDLEASGQDPPDIRPEAHEDRGADAVCAWIQEPGSRYGQGITVLLLCSPADRLCLLAEQLQDWAADMHSDPQRRPWPECPEHPDSHILRPENRDDVAVWCCPRDGKALARIGMLTRR